MKLVEIHKIKKSSKYFNLLTDFCKESNSLYNQALYNAKQSLYKNNKWLFYNDLNLVCKNQPIKYNNYIKLPRQCSQQVLKLLDKNLKSYLNSIKDWSKNKSKYQGMPKLPNYRKSGGLFQLILTNQQCKLKNNNMIAFPKVFNGLTLKLRKEYVNKINQVRILPKINCFKIEIIYEIDDAKLKDNQNIAAIDLGLKNLITLVYSNNKHPMIYKGNQLLKLNHDFNRKKNKYQSILAKTQKKKMSKRLLNIYNKRNNQIEDQMHKISKSIIDQLLENNISTLVVGHNVNQKQKSKLKNFVVLPIFKLIQLLKYKCKLNGIKLIEINESYTSGTSFIDNEKPIKNNYNKNRRVKRGLFKTNNGQLINSDVNAAYQIIRKYNNNIEIEYDNKIFNPQVMSA
mgnify:FL=1